MHAAEPARQHDHLEFFFVQIAERAVGLHADVLPALDHAAVQRGKLYLHAAAAQNVARRERFDRFKSGAK